MRGTHPAEINKQITTAKDVWLIVDIVLQHGAEFDAVNVATALHRMAKACPEDPTELLRSNGFEQLLLMVEAQVQVQSFSVMPCICTVYCLDFEITVLLIHLCCRAVLPFFIHRC